MNKPILIAAIAGLLAPAAFAQTIRITQPAHGQAVSRTSPFYDANQEAIKVLFTVRNLPRSQRANYEVYVNGQKYTPGNIGQLAWIGPTPPPGGWAPNAPFVQYFTDPFNPLVPIVAELYNTAQQQVVSRQKIVLYDARDDDDMEVSRTGELPRAIGVQLTPAGLEQLEPVHLDSLPQPSLAEFNRKFAANADGEAARTMDTALHNGLVNNNPNRVCYPWPDVKHLFPNGPFDPPNVILGQAAAAKLAYDKLKALVDSGVSAFANPAAFIAAKLAVEAACVKDTPSLNNSGDFEVCFETISGEITDLELKAVNDVDLSLDANSGQIDADPISLGKIEGAANLILSDAFIRWQKGAALCIGRPKVKFDNSVFTGDLADWAQCPQAEFSTSAAANVDPVGLQAGVKPSNVERIGFTQAAADFQITGTFDANADQGLCSTDSNVAGEAELLVAAFTGVIEGALTETWDQDQQHAEAMERLQDPFNVGTYEPQAQSLDWLFSRVGSFDDLDYWQDGLSDVKGFYGMLDTEVTPKPAVQINGIGSARFVYQPIPQPTPGVTVRPLAFSASGADPWQQSFDVGYMLTTGAVNQVLGSFEKSTTINFDFQTANSTLTQLIRQQLAGSEGEAPSIELRVRLRTTLPPFVFMHPDPPPIPGQQMRPPAGEWPLTYAMGQWRAVLQARRAGRGRWRTVVVGMADFYDNDLQLRIDDAFSANALVPTIGPAARITLTPTASRLKGCRLEAPLGTFAPLSCIGQLTTALQSEIELQVLNGRDPRLRQLVREIPAPQGWNAAGESNTTRRLLQNSVFTQDQYISFYSDLVQ